MAWQVSFTNGFKTPRRFIMSLTYLDTTIMLPQAIKAAPFYDSKQPFEICSLKDAWNNRKRECQPKRQERYHIIWVKKGRGDLLIDTNRHTISDNVIYCIKPKQVRNLLAEPGIQGCMISFTSDFLGPTPHNFNPLFRCGLFGNTSDAAVINVTFEIEHELNHIVNNLQKEFQNCSSLKMEILREYLKIFLIYLTRQVRQPDSAAPQLSRTELVNKFFFLLQNNFASKKLVTEYAEMLAVTANYLNNVVKRVSGFPASHHIQQQILQEAKRQAIYTDKTMKEIAYHLGFEANTHFSKFFKKNEGSNFSDYRKQMCNVMYS